MGRQGFTLLELLMVVIIIGILSSIALPQYLKTRERARMSEALSVLGDVRRSQVRFKLENDTYASALASLDYDPTNLSGTSLFTYTISSGNATLFVAQAVRTATVTGCAASYKITINQAGTWTGRDCQGT